MTLNTLFARWGGALLGAALVLGGSVASSATPDSGTTPAPDAGVAASDGTPTSLAIAVPITAPASSVGLIPAEQLELYTSTGGVLARQLDAVIARPVALGIDPMIIASIRILGTNAPQSAAEWLDRLESAPNETFSLAYADADVATLSQAGLNPITVPTNFVVNPELFPADSGGDVQAPNPSTTPSASPSPSPTPSTPTVPTGEQLVDLPFSLGPIVWPRDDTIVAADLGVFSAVEPTVTILSSGSISSSLEAIPASASSGGNALLVSDDTVSHLLREAATASTDAAWATAMSQLTSALAGWEGGSSTVLATADRELLASPGRMDATLAALATTPELAVTRLGSALSEAPVEVGIVDSPVPAERVALVLAMLQTEPATSAFATVLAQPDLITGDQRRRMLAITSNAWLDDPVDWAAAVDGFVASAGELLESVHVLESSTINLLSDTGDLPITISNALPYPVTVVVHVLANTAILDVLEDSVTVTIEPESQARAAIPVQSIANGDAVLSVSLTSSAGVPIGSPVYVTTNVQAGWETVFTLVVAVVILLVFILGIVRTVRRRRRERREGEAL